VLAHKFDSDTKYAAVKQQLLKFIQKFVQQNFVSLNLLAFKF